MTKLLMQALLCLIGFGTSGAAAGSMPETLQKGAEFPALEAESLTEENVTLPAALEGRGGIVIFTFSRDAGRAAADWRSALAGRLTGKVAPDIWQVMVLEDVPGLLRGFVAGGIRRGMPENLQARSLTLFADGDLWRRRCDLESDSIPCVILVDAADRIQWIRTATVNDSLIDSLVHARNSSQASTGGSEADGGAAPGGSPAGDAGETVFIFARFHALPGKEGAVREELLDTVTLSRDDPGCLGIHAFRSVRDPGLFYIYSRWEDLAAFENHVGLPHTLGFAERVQRLIDHPLKVARTQRIDPTDAAEEATEIPSPQE